MLPGLLTVAGLTLAQPAAGQIAGSVTVQNDYRLRGQTLSDERAVAILNLSYDDPSGFYGEISAAGGFDRDDRFKLVGIVGNIGYAHPITHRLSIDGGVIQTRYAPSFNREHATGYTEVYAGFQTGMFASHLYFSPSYFGRNDPTMYGEVEATMRPADRLRLNMHLGALVYLDPPPGPLSRTTQYDWRLTALRRMGPLDLSLSLSGGGPGHDYYAGASHNRTALIGGVSWTF